MKRVQSYVNIEINKKNYSGLKLADTKSNKLFKIYPQIRYT
jgi:hypothetical protein